MILRIITRGAFRGSLLGLVGIWVNPVPLDALTLVRLRGGVWCCDLVPDGQGNMISPIQGNPTPCPAPCTGGPAHVYAHNGTMRRVRQADNACTQPPPPLFCAQPRHDTYGLELCPQQGPSF